MLDTKYGHLIVLGKDWHKMQLVFPTKFKNNTANAVNDWKIDGKNFQAD